MEDVELYFEKNERTLLFRFLDIRERETLEGAIFYLRSLLQIGFLPLSFNQRCSSLSSPVASSGDERKTVDLWSGRKLSPF